MGLLSYYKQLAKRKRKKVSLDRELEDQDFCFWSQYFLPTEL